MKTGQLNYGKLRLLSLTEMGLFCARWAFSDAIGCSRTLRQLI